MVLSIKKIEYIFEKNQLLFFVLVFRVSPDHAVCFKASYLLWMMSSRNHTNADADKKFVTSNHIYAKLPFLFNTLLETSYRRHHHRVCLCIYICHQRQIVFGVHSYDRETKFKEIDFKRMGRRAYTLFGKLFY